MLEILWFCRRFSRESRRAGKAMKNPVISGLNPEIWQAWMWLELPDNVREREKAKQAGWRKGICTEYWQQSGQKQD